MFASKQITSEFTDLVKTYYPALCMVAERITKDYHAAQEIAQDVLMRYWEKQQVSKIESIPAYLYTSAKNASINYLNSAKSRKERDLRVSESQPENDSSASRAIIEAETERLIREAIDKLPDQCARVIRMIYNDGMSHKEIAAQLGVAESTVRNLKAKGIKQLRKSIPATSLLLLLAGI
jgi:RNA polymerase sigma-70 factor (family 1)